MTDTSTFPVYSSAAGPTIGRVLAWEQDYGFSREDVMVLAGDGARRDMLVGTVYGRRLFGDPVVAAGGANAGDGTVIAIAAGPAAKAGDYRLTAESPSLFSVVDPDGVRLADVGVGGTLDAAALTLTITAGGSAFVAGDTFIVTVPEGDGRVVPLDPTATDGTQVPAGVLAETVSAPDGVDTAAQGLERDCVLKSRGLIWPEGLTSDQAAAAVARLRAARIIIRQSL